MFEVVPFLWSVRGRTCRATANERLMEMNFARNMAYWENPTPRDVFNSTRAHGHPCTDSIKLVEST